MRVERVCKRCRAVFEYELTRGRPRQFCTKKCANAHGYYAQKARAEAARNPAPARPLCDEAEGLHRYVEAHYGRFFG